MRIDKYLKVTRLIKRRTIANEACDAEKISVNGKHGKRYTIASGIGLPLKTYVEKIAIIGENELILDGIGKKEYSNEQVMYLVGDISQTTEDTGFIPKWSFEEGIYETMKEYLGAM